MTVDATGIVDATDGYRETPTDVFKYIVKTFGGLTDADLARAYKSTVDPRLNYEQAMEVAMRIAGLNKA